MEFPRASPLLWPPGAGDTTHEVTTGTRNAAARHKGRRIRKTHSHCVGGISSLCEQ